MSEIGRVLQEGEANGAVLNAKGDLASGIAYNIIAADNLIGQTATINVNVVGNMQKFDNGFLNGTADWVETGPNPPAWIGASNYEIRWSTPIDNASNAGGTHSPTTQSSGYPAYIAMSNFVFFTQVNAGQGEESWSWPCTIRNIATGATTSGNLRCNASSGFA